MSKYTKSEWFTDEENEPWRIYSQTGFLIADCGMSNRIGDDEMSANTQLIAAAPDMLAALEELYNAEWLSLPGRAGDIVEAAILKAKGEA